MLTEEQKRVHRVCFTGHRPEKLNLSESVIVKALETAIKEAIADGKNVFISGSLTTCNLQKSVDILQKKCYNISCLPLWWNRQTQGT